MKKALKYFGIFILVILVILIITPFLFKGKITSLIKEEIDKNVKARVEFSGVSLSLLRNFPDLTVSIKNLKVIGIEDFEQDTLVSMNNFRLTLELMSVIKGDAIGVKSILLDSPVLLAKVIADGQANWDIMIETEEEEEVIVAEEESALVVKLKNFVIKNGKVVYDDASMAVYVCVDEFNAKMKGDLTLDVTTLEIDATSGKFDFDYEGMRYINKARLDIQTLLDFDLNRLKFDFKDAHAMLNALELGFDGWFEMPESDINFDLTFYSKKAEFKTILSLVPAIYMTDFESLKTSGNLSLKGFAKGTYGETTLPDVGLDLLVENGMFQYPDLPASVNNVNVAMNLFYDGTNDDRTTVDISKFHFEMAGNPFDFTLSVRNPMTTMNVKGNALGKINFANVLQVVPLEGMNLKGLLDANLSFNGNVADLEAGKYEDFNARGLMSLTGFEFESPDLPQKFFIHDARMEFSPRFVELNTFDSRIGESDLKMNGRLENFIPYVFSDQVLKGNLTFTSNLLNLNELMTDDAPVEESTDTIPLSVIEVPANIDFTLASNIGQIKYDNLDIRDARGVIRVIEGKILLENMGMKMLQGEMLMSGEYNTQDMTNPFVDFALDIVNFDIPATFDAFVTVQKLAPIAKGLSGAFSTKMKFNSKLGEDMMPVFSTINGFGNLSSSSVELVNVETFDKISNALKLDESKSNVLNDINAKFTIKDGKVIVDPFNIKLRSINMLLGGEHSLDQSMNYLLKLAVPRSEFGSAANEVINNLVASAAAKGLKVDPSEKVNIDVKIGGTLLDPKFSLDMGGAGQASMDQLKEQVQTQIKAEVDEKIDEAETKIREGLSERAQKLIQDAEKQAESIMKTAEETAQSVRTEANLNAAKIEKEAEGKNVLAQRAAKAAADKLRKDGEASAKKIISEAQIKSDAIIEKAKAEAEKL
jgi:hypothetical protein